jgi:hypothetical protein
MIHTKGKLLAWVRSPVSEEDFALLYQTELPKIYNFFRFRVGDGPLAEDLTAETFEKAWRWLIWESNGITYSLFGDGLAQSELIHIAESLNS